MHAQVVSLPATFVGLATAIVDEFKRRAEAVLGETGIMVVDERFHKRMFLICPQLYWSNWREAAEFKAVIGPIAV